MKICRCYGRISGGLAERFRVIWGETHAKCLIRKYGCLCTGFPIEHARRRESSAKATEFSAAATDNPLALNFTLQRYLALRKLITAQWALCSFDLALSWKKRGERNAS